MGLINFVGYSGILVDIIIIGIIAVNALYGYYRGAVLGGIWRVWGALCKA